VGEWTRFRRARRRREKWPPDGRSQILLGKRAKGNGGGKGMIKAFTHSYSFSIKKKKKKKKKKKIRRQPGRSYLDQQQRRE